jgi:hypothetical protein
MEAIGWLLWALAAAEVWRRCNSSAVGPSWLWRTLLAGAFWLLRWPLLTAPHELSPDESQSLAGALTLWVDPVFWRSVDGATAGPLHYYMLMPAALLPGSAAYLGARMMGGVLILATLFLAGRLLRHGADEASERVAVFIAITAAAFSRTPDLQHASTELLPGFLLTLAIAVYTSSHYGRARLWIAGLALGLVPWGKLQAAPLALIAGLVALFLEWRGGRQRDAVILIAAGLLPTLLVVAWARAVGVDGDMATTYFAANGSYGGASLYSPWSALRGLWSALREDGYAAIWIVVGVVAGCFGLIARRKPKASRNTGFAVAGWFAAAMICVAWPRRPYLHYWHLLTAPWLLLTGLAWHRLQASGADSFWRRWLQPRIVVPVVLLWFVAYRVAGPRHVDWIRLTFERHGTENRELAGVARKHLAAGDRLAVWGNRSSLYLSLGLAQATRQAHTEMQIRPGPFRPYFLKTWWEDFAAKRPALFADATGAGNIGFDDRNYSSESFPPLAEAVRRDYTLLLDRFGVRLYLRNDRRPAAP